ncbi:MAG TPA: hypothetical protein VNB24_02960 [Acidimicrobiales bacterium]|nr:hypothetical protein [Acidimicrobiales bacterium]
MTSERIVRTTVAATTVFVVTAVLGVAVEPARPVAVAVALVLFVGGAVGMLAAVVVAAGRSRTDSIGIGGLFFLAGVAPATVRRILIGCFAAQSFVGVATAIARPYSTAAFGVLAPVGGLAACGLWAAKHGQFGPRN